ncbi:RidA family protein [Ensifer sp.]|jgi:enamine deaminase RidA (YjgF/YER057c/UK114 family)|uniref:RidA family protein n=1 Tax=Ensifer sp. TaxID=1872086 RepID=UPI002E0F170F|nr:RidA family protein [Ensifer sp.]
MTKRNAIFPANRHALYEAHGYSAAIESQDLLFVSGQVGSREDGSPEPDYERQVERAFDNLEATLKAAGATFDDIVDITTFHTEPENQFETFMAVKSRIFPEKPYPNWTAIGVNWLAGFDFEIKVIARVPAGQKAA